MRDRRDSASAVSLRWSAVREMRSRSACLTSKGVVFYRTVFLRPLVVKHPLCNHLTVKPCLSSRQRAAWLARRRRTRTLQLTGVPSRVPCQRRPRPARDALSVQRPGPPPIVAAMTIEDPE